MRSSRVSFFLLTALFAEVHSGCSILSSRPVQEMSYTAAAIRAAKEVQADTLAPELYRQASEWLFKARREYKLKNFKLAKDYSEKARFFAEQAEFEALRGGGNRDNASPADSAGPAAPAPSQPYAYPTPEGTPADVYEQRKSEDEKRKAAAQAPPVAPQPSAPQTSGPVNVPVPAPR